MVSSLDLVDVAALIPDAVLDVRYATTGNFLAEAVYPRAAVFLKKPTAEKLKKAADSLRAKGFRLRLYDGYRPVSVQKLMWRLKPDPRYVANPQKGSSHNRGAGVDVGLVRLDGSAVELPSDFDEFGPTAHYGQGTAEAQKNAALLRAEMQAAGFRPLDEEWWHYSDPDGKEWPALDVPFDRIEA